MPRSLLLFVLTLGSLTILTHAAFGQAEGVVDYDDPTRAVPGPVIYNNEASHEAGLVPTHENAAGIGGVRVVSTIAARDGIPSIFRGPSMVVFVRDDGSGTGRAYTFDGTGLTNSDWVEVEAFADLWASGGGGSSTFTGLSDVTWDDPQNGQVAYWMGGTLLNATLTFADLFGEVGDGQIPSGVTRDSELEAAIEAARAYPVRTIESDHTLSFSNGDHTRSLLALPTGANTITIPTNASEPFPTGTYISVYQADAANSMTVAPAGGVTLNGSCTLDGFGESVTLLKAGTNTWNVYNCNDGSGGGGGSWDGGTVSGVTTFQDDVTVQGATNVQDLTVNDGLSVSAGALAIPGYPDVAATLGAAATQSALEDSSAAIRSDFPDPSGFDATGVPDGWMLVVENESVVAAEVEDIPDPAATVGLTNPALSFAVDTDSSLVWVQGGEATLPQDLGTDDSPTFTNLEVKETLTAQSYRGPGAFRGVIASGDLTTTLADGEWACVSGVDSLALRDGSDILKWAFDLHDTPADNTTPTVDSLYVAQSGEDVLIRIDADEEGASIQVESTGPNGSNPTFTEADFTATEDAGVWTHEATHTAPALGFWTYELTGFADAANNQATVGQSDTLTVVEAPSGVVITESFDKADGADLGPDLAWTDIMGDWSVVSNQAQAGMNEHVSRADTPLSTADQYAQAVVTEITNSAVLAGVYARMSESDVSSLSNTIGFLYKHNSTDTYRLFIRTDGTQSQIGTTVNAAPLSTPFVLRIEVEESGNDTIVRGLVDGSQVITATIPSHAAANRHAGIWRTSSNETVVTMDDFEAGDL